MILEVLVPTYKKNAFQCIELAKKLNINSPYLICCQSNNKQQIFTEGNRILFFNNIGISNNRNNLLDNAVGDICVCIDDDCPLEKNYQEIISEEFKKYPTAEFILFNGIVCKENDRLVHNKKTKFVNKYSSISYAGGPGLVFKKDAIKKYGIRYNEQIAFPNKIVLGEDSLFYYQLIEAGAKILRSNKIIFRIKEDVDNSSYFNGVTNNFIISKGCIIKLVHPRLYWLFKYYYSFKMLNWRDNKISYFEMLKLFKKGFKEANKINFKL